MNSMCNGIVVGIKTLNVAINNDACKVATSHDLTRLLGICKSRPNKGP
jgi:hypothetical protein